MPYLEGDFIETGLESYCELALQLSLSLEHGNFIEWAWLDFDEMLCRCDLKMRLYRIIKKVTYLSIFRPFRVILRRRLGTFHFWKNIK